MKAMRATLLLCYILPLLLLLFTTTTILAKKDTKLTNIAPCTGHESIGAQCTLTIRQLRPTQLPFGRLAAKCKQDKFESFAKKSKLETYLLEHPVPVVIGASQIKNSSSKKNEKKNNFQLQFFMTDHHHMVRAYFDATFSRFDWERDPWQRTVVVEVVNRNTETPTDSKSFWQWMIGNNYSYAYDEHGRPLVDIQRDLPRNVTQLVNDPYRSLSFLVRSYAGYGKVPSLFFLEFVWANYFRKQGGDFAGLGSRAQEPWSVEEHEMDVLFGPAMELALSPVSKHLPGYGTGEVKLPGCAMWNDFLRVKEQFAGEEMSG